MAEFIKSLKDFVRPVVAPVAELLGLRNLFAGLIMLGVGIILVVCVIIAIVSVVKTKKKKAAALEKAKALASSAKAKQNALVQQAVDANKAEESSVEQAKPQEPVNEVTEEQVEAQPAQEVAENAEEKPLTKPKAPSAKKAPAKKPASKKPFVGKWVVELKSEGEYVSKLIASNGEVMLSSEIYSSAEGAKAGISTIIKWVEDGTFVIYEDKKKNYYYKLKTSGNRLICVGEIYKSEEQCKSAVESVKRIAKDATLVEELVVGEGYVDYKPQPLAEEVKGLKGKWRIESAGDDKYSAKLYASNGQLMIATEAVASKKTATSAIESVRRNSADGNFIIDKDKFGRFYYKLRNAQKSVICIGEAYDRLDSCINSLESVRKFAINSIIVTE